MPPEHPSTHRDPSALRLRHGRWDSLILRDGTIIVLYAFNRSPGRYRWQLLEERPAVDGDDSPAHLLVSPDGTLVPDSGLDFFESEHDAMVVRQGLTAFDLVPADAAARLVWRALVGSYTICPRCGGTDGRGHHPHCHTANGVPLFPNLDARRWLEMTPDGFTAWESGIGIKDRVGD